MVPFFPKQISYRAISVYLAALIIVSVYYFFYAMSSGYIALGIFFVVGFFLLTSKWSSSWKDIPDKQFIRNLFYIALILRIVWVISVYYYYTKATGTPFEFGAADSLGYHDEAEWLSHESWGTIWSFYFGPETFGFSDVGYPLYLTFLYKLFGSGVMLPRIIKAFLSSWMCILVYRLSARTFGESCGRMAGIMCTLMPNLIIYCGLHLKETEMLFLEVAFMERLDHFIRCKRSGFWNIIIPTVLALVLFFFRTVLGAVAVFTFITVVLFSSAPTMKRGWHRTAMIAWGILCLIMAGGGTIVTELESYWEAKNENLSRKRQQQTMRGNLWAQYATGAVMAPMVFVLPFSTMVDVSQQYSQQERHAGNYVRNFMGFFAILAVYEAFRRKKWRDFTIIGAFAISYLGIVSITGFNNSERFLLPGLPCLIMMWAYGVSTLRAKSFKLLTPWCILVVLMEFAWAYFKLGSRGLF